VTGRALRWALACLLYWSGALPLARALRRAGPPSVVILRYHRVLNERTGGRFYRLGIRDEIFRSGIRYLARHYEILDLETAVRRLQEPASPGAAARGVSVVVTFDDGYADNDAPLRWLREQGIPATVFVVSGPIDARRPFFWERLALLFEKMPSLASAPEGERRRRFDDARARVKRMPHAEREAELSRLAAQAGVAGPAIESQDDLPLTWDEVRALARAGVRFGGHTDTHPLLTCCTDEDVRREIACGNERLAAEAKLPVASFAYPTGDVDRRVRDLTAASGVAIALTCAPGRNRPGADPLMLRRKGVGELVSEGPRGGFSRALWAAEIEGVFDALRALKRAG